MSSTNSEIVQPIVIALMDFNKKLLSDMKELTVHRYVEEMNESFFHMDISFMEDNMEYLVNKGKCCVPHTKLWEMGVVAKTTSANILKLLTVTHDFKAGNDFICKTYKTKNGGSPTKKYFMTPNAYFKCLMRSKNTDKYANYFIMLQEAVHYHSLYHKELSEGRALLSKKAEEKAKAETKVAKEETKVAKAETSAVLKKFYEDTKRRDAESKAEREKHEAKMNNMYEKIMALGQQRVPDPPQVNQKEQIKIVKLSQLNRESPMYYIMRRQQKGMTSAINKLATKMTVERVVVTINTPNAKNMFLRARGLLGDQMTVRGNVVTPKQNKEGLTPVEIRDIFTSIKTNDTTVTLEA